MRGIGCLLLFVVLQVAAYSQKETTYQSPQASLPAWAQLMYQDNADAGAVVAAYEAYYATNPFIKNEHTQYYKRWLRSMARTLPTDGRQPVDRSYLRLREAEAQRIVRSTLPTEWESIGPWDWDHDAADRSYAPGAAHVYVVEQSLSDPDVLYAGTATAGVWKSVNHGDDWVNVTKEMLVNGCTALEIDHQDPDVVYAEILGSIYKTSDGGLTWLPTGDAAFQALSIDVKDIRMHPDDATHVLAATGSGLYRTLNAGTGWTLVLAGDVLEVEYHPTDHDTVYTVTRNGDVTEFFRSVDNGVSFTQMTSGWPVPDVPAGEHQRRTEIAVTPAAPDHVFALATGSANGGSGLYGVYVSTDAGVNWTFTCCGPQPAGPPSPTNQNLMGWSDDGTDDGGQYYYDLALDVSPTNADSVFVAGVNLWVSDDGGASFVCPAKWSHSYKPNYVHADIHDVHYYASTGEIWIACDGGIFFSDDNGANFTRKINGISGTDFWGFGMGFWDGEVMLGGTYHNGTLLKDNNVYLNGWISTDGGDNYRGFVNPGLARQAYSDYNIKALSGDRTVNNATRAFNYKPNATYTTGRSSDLLFHPAYYGTWYSGSGTELWKTTDNGFTYVLIYDFGSDVAAMAISRSHPEVMYACTFPDWWAEKKIYRSDDGGESWTEITPPAAQFNNAHLWVPFDIEVSATDPDKIWILRTSMYGGTDLDGVGVFTSDDGGQTWQNLSTPTLDGQAFTALMHQAGTNGGVYVGTRTAVFYRNATMPDWELYSAGLPARANAVRLLPYYRKETLRNATNRSVWERDFYEPSSPIAQPAALTDRYYCLEDTVFFTDHSILSETGVAWSWSFPGGTPATASVRNPKVVYDKPGVYDVSLTITDVHGSDTRTFPQMIRIEDQCSPDTVPGRALICYQNPDHVLIDGPGILADHLTISAWVKPDSIQNDYTGIVMNDGPAAGFNFREGNNTLGYHWPGGAWWWDSNLEVVPDVWSHVAMVVTPSQVRLYVNGTEAIHNVATSPADLQTMRIGSYQGWGGRNFAGLIDEVCIWNRALTPAEIRASRHLIKRPAEDTTLIAYFQFNADGSTVYNKAGAGDGTLNGGAAKVRSRIPVGPGTSQAMTITATGTYDFDEVGLKLTFGAGATVPGGEVYATRLNILPDTTDQQHVPLATGYWVLNNYGTQPLITHPDSARFSALAFISPVMRDSTDVDLQVRGENTAEQPWMTVAKNPILEEGRQGAATFLPPGNLTELGQVMIVRDSFPPGMALVTMQDTAEQVVPKHGGASVLLDLATDDQGLGLPLLSTPDFTSIPQPVAGLVAYHTDSATVCFFDGSTWQLLETSYLQQPVYDTVMPRPGIAIGGGVNDPGALLDLSAAEGLVLPGAFSDSTLLAIDFPRQGLLAFDETSSALIVYDGIDWRPFKHFSSNLAVNPAPPAQSLPGMALGTTVKNPNAVLDLKSATRALRVPVTTAGSIINPPEGLLIFDANQGALCLFDGDTWRTILLQ
ncbi:MAG: LamG-like jellyroll fold domain-containing protein [Saprospiraceae bacterium]|nr:LamG-like jellyroll fold domain-containing protein [Saprospiraceae bacterium]